MPGGWAVVECTGGLGSAGSSWMTSGRHPVSVSRLAALGRHNAGTLRHPGCVRPRTAADALGMREKSCVVSAATPIRV